MTLSPFYEQLDPLLPIDFFSVSWQMPKGSEVAIGRLFSNTPPLPDLTPYLSEEKFAEVYFVWSDTGISGKVVFQKPFENSSFPNYQDGDSVEIFIDTRDMKQAGWATRFCHHFVFLGHAVQDIQAEEMTRFRSADAHTLCDASELVVSSQYGTEDFSLTFFIPATCLHGFDPGAFPRIGMTYRINRYKGPPQHFSVSSNYFDVMQHPSLWSSVRLVNS